jgi:hypothetical protein
LQVDVVDTTLKGVSRNPPEMVWLEERLESAGRNMPKQTEKTNVQGGWVKRDVVSGRFVEVGTGKTVFKGTPKSESAVAQATEKRSEALRRLADR